MNSAKKHCLGGRLRHFLPFWHKICFDRQVLKLLQGVEFEFTSEIRQTSFPRPITMSKEEHVYMNTKITTLLRDSSIRQVPHPHRRGWVSNVFLVPKCDGGYRMILNLKELNKHIRYRKFKMDHIHQVISLIQPNMWLASLDIFSAFSHLYVVDHHQKFLCFEWDSKYF